MQFVLAVSAIALSLFAPTVQRSLEGSERGLQRPRQAGVWGRSAQIKEDTSYPVKYVVDGDTLQVAGVGRVRLLGIDAPDPGRGFDTSEPFAQEARERLRQLVGARYVRLEYDQEARDAYGRRLAYVFRDDGLFVNTAMLREGLARVMARVRLRRLGELERSEAEARAARRGMWR